MGEGRGRRWPKFGALTLPCPCQAIMTYPFSISEVSIGVLRAWLGWAVQRARAPGRDVGLSHVQPPFEEDLSV